jgi:hypothetical protein
LGVWNGLIQFTLFLMGKFNSKVKQLESWTVSWNGLCSKFEVPLYSLFAFIAVTHCFFPVYQFVSQFSSSFLTMTVFLHFVGHMFSCFRLQVWTHCIHKLSVRDYYNIFQILELHVFLLGYLKMMNHCISDIEWYTSFGIIKNKLLFFLPECTHHTCTNILDCGTLPCEHCREP